MTDFVVALSFSVLFNVAMFVPAYITQTDKLTDISYALSFIALISFSFFTSNGELGHVVLLSMIIIWAVRLGGYLYMRINRMRRDKRFDGIREYFLSFLRFWVLQGVTVPIVLVSALLYMSIIDVSVSLISIAGIAIFSVGFLVEAIADSQKWKFSSNPANKDKWIASGLWGISRHPNYLGEILVWTGVYIFVAPELASQGRLIALLSPIYIAVLLLFVSGIPLLEKSADKKWGTNQNYLAYKKRTPVLVPFVKF